MAHTVTKLPTEERPIRMAPALFEAVEEMLENYTGNDLEAAQNAVVEVYKSDFSGSFPDLLERYREAIEEAVEEA